MSLLVFQPPHLDDIRLLCAVVDRGSFSAAAQHVGTTQPRVSRAIARLEERLGVSLVQRSSRGISVTAEGARYASQGRRLLGELQSLESTLLDQTGDAGPLRVSAPPAVAHRVLQPHLTSFCQQNPQVALQLSLGARRVGLIQEDFDVAVRFGPLDETWRRARRILAGRYHAYAAPSLALPPVEQPEALAEVPALVLHATHLRDRWPFIVEGETRHVTVTPQLLTDDVDSLIDFCVAGLGTTMLPDFLVEDEVADGRLVRLTTESQAVPAHVYAVTNSPPPRASLFVAHLAQQLSHAATSEPAAT